MPTPSPWIDASNAALLTDLYELTMLQAYWREGMSAEAVFSLYVRRLPPRRNYLLACGLDSALDYVEHLRFAPPALESLADRGEFQPEFLDWLRDFRFTGDVYAVDEGTPVFANEPLLEVVAPLPQAQLLESFVMNQMHHQTVMASKASRVVSAATGRRVVDFGLRRMHGTDAGVKAARAFFIAGVAATSNVFAGLVYAIPIAGTMAHSYVQTHDDEKEAFRLFAELYPETILLVDTYDTLAGVRHIVELARELGSDFHLRGVRLDSGDLAHLSRKSRRILDEAGLRQVEIFASGGLDETEIRDLLAAGAPIDGFGVGTHMGVSEDAPSLDMVYKLTAYAGRGRIKLAPGKPVLPGRKQVYRREHGGEALGDVVAAWDEPPHGRPLLAQVMEGGRRLPRGRRSLVESRALASRERAQLPPSLLSPAPAPQPYPVETSETLQTRHRQVETLWKRRR